MTIKITDLESKILTEFEKSLNPDTDESTRLLVMSTAKVASRVCRIAIQQVFEELSEQLPEIFPKSP